MQTKILVLNFEAPGTLSHDDYRNFFENINAGIPVTVVSPDELLFVITKEKVELLVGSDQTPISEFTHLIARGSVDKYRDIVLPAVYIAQVQGVACWNGSGGSFARSKLAQTIQMQQAGLPIPTTVFSMNRKLLGDAITRYLEYPCIVKDWRGAHGNNNFLIGSEHELEEMFVTVDDNLSFVAQEYIPNDGDYRYLVVNGQSLTIHRSSIGQSHLNNTSQGASASLAASHALPEDITQLAKIYAAKYELFIYGADIIRHKTKEEYYFLEFNSQPQLLTGAFLGEKRAMMRRALGLE